MSEEITQEQARQVLDLELGNNDSGQPTVRGYLLRLLADVWTEGEGFDGKRPFGNSSWDYDIKIPMLKAGIISGKLDEDGDVIDLDDEAADRLILAAIAALDAPREADDKPQPAKVIIVTEQHGDTSRERRYDAGQADGDDYGRLMLLRRGRPVAGFQPDGWLGWRKDDALVPDATARALAIARRALEAIAKQSPTGPGLPAAMQAIATDALDEIYAETE